MIAVIYLVIQLGSYFYARKKNLNLLLKSEIFVPLALLQAAYLLLKTIDLFYNM
jgi:hypothetical protein